MVRLHVHPECITSLKDFKAIARPLIHHELGWKTLPDSDITLTPDQTLSRLFPALKHLSVCKMRTGEIWINEDNWLGLRQNASGLPLAAYRAYVVQHEMGHALGLYHVPLPSTGLAPIMVQQTLGIGSCIPYPFPHLKSSRRGYNICNDKWEIARPLSGVEFYQR